MKTRDLIERYMGFAEVLNHLAGRKPSHDFAQFLKITPAAKDYLNGFKDDLISQVGLLSGWTFKGKVEQAAEGNIDPLVAYIEDNMHLHRFLEDRLESLNRMFADYQYHVESTRRLAQQAQDERWQHMRQTQAQAKRKAPMPFTPSFSQDAQKGEYIQVDAEEVAFVSPPQFQKFLTEHLEFAGWQVSQGKKPFTYVVQREDEKIDVNIKQGFRAHTKKVNDSTVRTMIEAALVYQTMQIKQSGHAKPLVLTAENIEMARSAYQKMVAAGIEIKAVHVENSWNPKEPIDVSEQILDPRPAKRKKESLRV